MGMISQAIKEKLEIAFNPSRLDVIDETHKHAGHAGAAEYAAHQAKDGTDGDGAGAQAVSGPIETHIHVIITSEAFSGLNTLAKHRAVMEALQDEIAQLHAFSLEASA